MRRRVSVYPGKRYLDWELEDPAGKPLATVRRIRDEIDERVQALLRELAPASVLACRRLAASVSYPGLRSRRFVAIRPSRMVKSMKSSPSRNGISRNLVPAMPTITCSPAARNSRRSMPRSSSLPRCSMHSFHDGVAPVADEGWAGPLVDDVGVETGRRPPRCHAFAERGVIEDHLKCRIAHRLLLRPRAARRAARDQGYRHSRLPQSSRSRPPAPTQ